MISSGYVRLNYNSTCTDFKYLSVSGVDDFDSVGLFPEIKNQFMGGARKTQFKGFRRHIIIDFGVIDTVAKQIAILNFKMDNSRFIGFGAEDEIFVVPANADGFENSWVDGVSIAKKYVIELTETSIRTTFPV